MQQQRPNSPGSEANEEPLISGDSPDSETTGEEPFTPVDDRSSLNVNPQGLSYVFSQTQAPSVYSHQEESRNRIELDGGYLADPNVEKTKERYQGDSVLRPPHPFHMNAHQAPNGQYYPPPNQGSIPLQPTTFYSPQQYFDDSVVGPTMAHRVERPAKYDGHQLAQGQPLSSQPDLAPRSSQGLPIPLPVPVHPASLTIWAEDTRSSVDLIPGEMVNIPRKEGPKVVGRPKPGIEGGIFW